MDNDTYDSVVISGGGMKGIYALGTLHYYYEIKKYDMDAITTYVGTSIGAIISLLLICGYTPIELFQFIYKTTDFFPYTTDNSFSKIFTHKGLMHIKTFMFNFEKLILNKLGKVPTFIELYNMFNKNLVMITYNRTKGMEEKLSHLTYPDLPVIIGCEMSCALPGIFYTYVHNKCEYIDGGLVNNFPLDAITNEESRVLSIILHNSRSNSSTKETGFMDVIHQLMMAPINRITSLTCKNLRSDIDVVIVHCRDIPLVALQLSAKQKMNMFLQGYNTAEIKERKEYLFLRGWNDSIFDYHLSSDDEWGNW